MRATKLPELDDFDHAILRELQESNATPLHKIAERVNLSTAAVQRRIRRLEETGVIQANVAIVDPTRIGLPITILVEVHVERAHMEDLDAMKAHLSGPEVQQCYYVTGDADFVLVVTVATMADYEDLARRLFYEHKNIKWFRSIVVMDRVKVGLTLPIHNVEPR
ncbi:Lrp/AsnC family transcriptional regulator [Bradyrhizobium tropiciagri]|uniref:Lrp/AsnC family transcriptional regulator n=1 Tax=Bradyrhizobium tropiciagri TaxID=312253 RepID=UPI001BA82258|nr:Lrp/AsnC family transcriptional regulator [Bradyrhizobium tropiciagri]MBR0898931.1 Lrp/AsnC family transcriptional regulator [Bradyrhizobium tropiciagri]